MKKKFSIYHFLVALMLSTLILPGFVGAAAQTDDGSLTIHKFEREPGAAEGEAGDGSADQNVPEDAIKLQGVTFKITQTHAYDAVHDKWTAVDDGQSIEKTTDAQGQAVFAELAYGRYTVEEIAGPSHVVRNTEVYSVDIPMTNAEGTELNYNVHIYPKNETIRGGAELIKTDGDTKKKLDGVQFQVFHKSGEPVTGENGEPLVLTTSNGIVTVDGLAYGDYYFLETVTVNGYLIKGEKVPFKIKKSNKTVRVSLENYKKPEVEKEVDKDEVNRGEEVTFTISVTLPKDIAEYASFKVTDVLDNRLEYVDGSQSNPAGFDFNHNGQTLTWNATDFDQLKPGKLDITFKAKVKEDAAANEPIPNAGEIDYDNSYQEDGDKTPDVTVTPTVGSLTVKKVDGDTEKGLAGAEFELRDVNGTVVATGTSGSDGTVNFNGETDELDYGDYQLVETKAPADYNLLRNPIDVTIDKENSEVNLTVDNYKSGWNLPKTGGIGTMLFTFIGLSLMGGASFMFARRRNGEQA